MVYLDIKWLLSGLITPVTEIQGDWYKIASMPLIKGDFSLSTQYTQGRDAKPTIKIFERAYANSLIPRIMGEASAKKEKHKSSKHEQQTSTQASFHVMAH